MERFHQSQAKVLVQQCPAVLRYQELHPRESTDAMDMGSLLDHLVFERSDKYQVVEVEWGVYASGKRKGQPRDKNWKHAAADARREELEAEGILGVLQSDVDALQDQVEEARDLLIELTRLSAGATFHTQPKLQWLSALGVECEGTPDAVIVGTHEVRTVDLKRSTAIHPRAMQRQIASMAWDLQGAAYKEAALYNFPGRAYAGHTLIACQSGGARLVETYTLDDVYMTIGQMRWEEGQRIWQRCCASGEWPGYTHLDTTVGPTRWQVHETIGYDEADDDLSELGLRSAK